VVKHS